MNSSTPTSSHTFPLLTIGVMSSDQKAPRIHKLDSILAELLFYYPNFDINLINDRFLLEKLLKTKRAHEEEEHFALLYYDALGRVCLHGHPFRSIVMYDTFPLTAPNEDLSQATRIIECVDTQGRIKTLHQKIFSHLDNEEVCSWERLGNIILSWDPNIDPKNRGNFPNAMVFYCEDPHLRALVDTCFFVVFMASRTNSSVRAPMRFRTPEPLRYLTDLHRKCRRFHLEAYEYVHWPPVRVLSQPGGFRESRNRHRGSLS